MELLIDFYLLYVFLVLDQHSSHVNLSIYSFLYIYIYSIYIVCVCVVY